MNKMNNVISINPDDKVYYLCSEGNRNIIQASKNKKDITKAMEDLNKLASKYDGFNRTKFYLLEQ